MNSRRAQIILAVVFLCVGILATLNAWRLNTYIAETLPRDRAQEQCNAETIGVLRGWVQARTTRDDAMNRRDDATIIVLDKISAGGRATPEEVRAWRDAIATDRRVRAEFIEQRIPLPDC